MTSDFISNFIEDLGYKDYAKKSGFSVETDKYGYYHLKIENLDFEIEMILKNNKSDYSVENTINYRPHYGVNISSEVVEFIDVLRKAQTAQLCEYLDKVKDVMYDCIKQKAYDDYKKCGYSGDWNKVKKGKVIVPFTYEFYGFDAEYYYRDRMGEYPIAGPKYSDFINAISEGVLEVWKEMTGRNDLYVYEDGDKDGAYICSK